MSSFFSKSKITAPINYNRWLIPPAALAIHLCIGQIYAYSVFNEPMTRILGIAVQHENDWEITSIGWIFSIALFTLGASAALFGKWVERVGPRLAMFVAACCFGGGFLVASIGVYTHQLSLVYIGNGVLGGIGLGIGYISPVSTLIKWFPDRPGMATGMAIMGFGGGAMIASPLSVYLMDLYSNDSNVGIWQTFLVLGVIYFLVMLIGVVLVRVPAKEWIPKGYEPTASNSNKMMTSENVSADNAIKTPQFYLVFAVLLLNVSAGIGVLGQASLMIQEIFAEQGLTVADAAAFVGILSLFNMLGRFFWSSLSDKIGRKNTYSTYFVLGAILYCLIPSIGNTGSVWMFVATFAIIISMYGGGFATVPAYLRDLFGTFQVGAIHGRLLLAWSLAAIVGPVLVNYLRAYQLDTLGQPPAQVYNTTMYILASLLLIGLIANWLIKPVHKKYHNSE